MYALKVEKMSCGGCANRVTRTVQALDPEAKVEVVLEDRLVRVESVKTLDAIAAAITAAGYPASDVTAA
jgi:copper chaperone